MPLLDTKAAGEYVGLAKSTMEAHRRKKTGPRYSKGKGRTSGVRYTEADLDAWNETRKVEPNGEG